MSLLSPIKSSPAKRKPEKDVKSPEKRQQRSEIDDMILLEQDEPTEEELEEIEDSAADLDAREDAEEKMAILDIVSDEKFEKNHPIEVGTNYNTYLIDIGRFIQISINFL